MLKRKRGVKIKALKERLKKYKHGIIILSVICGILALSLILFLLIDEDSIKQEPSIKTCGDGTFYGRCSFNEPYFCDEGKLIKSPEKCGCSEILNKENGECVSKYEEGSKNVTFEYYFDGDEKEIDMEVYKGVYDYVSSLDRSLTYGKNEKSNRGDFKRNAYNDEVQREYLVSLLVKIQNQAPESKLNQLRIATSLVQNIKYESTGRNITTGIGEKIEASRYPYEVLYENKGICGEKTALLGFLAKELGYGTTLFYFPYENHEALGVKCPVEESYDETGYCFIETTKPAIISDSEIEYEPIGKLSDNYEIYRLSEGRSLPEGIREYEDAEKMEDLRKKAGKGNADIFDENKYSVLKKRYGLEH